MRATLMAVLFSLLAHNALAQHIKIKTPDGDVEMSVSPGAFGPAAGCERYPTCGNCVLSVTNACGWCVESGQCVSREAGACGTQSMAVASTQCPMGPSPRGAPGVTVVMPGGHGAPVVRDVGMEPAAFNELVDALKEEGFEDARLNVLQEAATHNSFTVAQVGTVLDLFAFSKGKLEALTAMRARIVDPQNNFQVYKHFAFKQDQDKARRILGGR